ncbi:MAG: hypothetical protein ACRCXK_12590 [Wohlfahrtiimonas sp.]
MIKRLILEGYTSTEIISLSTTNNFSSMNENEKISLLVNKSGSYILHLYIGEDIPKNITHSFILKDNKNTIIDESLLSHGTCVWGDDFRNVIDLPNGQYKVSIYPINIVKLHKDNEVNMLHEQSVRKRVEAIIGQQRYQKAKQLYLNKNLLSTIQINLNYKDILFILFIMFFLPLPTIWGNIILILLVTMIFLVPKIYLHCTRKDVEIFSKIHIEEQQNYYPNFIGELRRIL